MGAVSPIRTARHAPKVAVVSASLVRRYFTAGENPIGHKIKVGKPAEAALSIRG